MRTTITLDDELLATARSMTGIEETPSLIRAGLKALIEREAGRRLMRLGGIGISDGGHPVVVPRQEPRRRGRGYWRRGSRRALKLRVG